MESSKKSKNISSEKSKTSITIYEAVRECAQVLGAAGIEQPLFEARSILCGILRCGMAWLYAHGEDTLDAEAFGKYYSDISMRARNVPLQHLTGRQEFMSLDFIVNGSVLIPRQDTEILAETIIDEYSNAGRSINILDLCTGSGCIAVSLAHWLPECGVIGSDISCKAIEVACENARLHKVEDRVSFICGNLFDGIREKMGYGIKFDCIVSNPPYIPTEVIDNLSIEVKDYEPRLALDGGDDGLDYYRKIVSEAPGFLKNGGMLAFETGIDQAQSVKGLMMGEFTGLRVIKDLSGIERVVCGYLR